MFFKNKGNITAQYLVGDADYLHNENSIGFEKNFQDSHYGFMAILPNDCNISLSDYINTMTGEKFLSLLKSKDNTSCKSYLPMFKYNYSFDLKQPLIKLGLSDSFDDRADFWEMGNYGGTGLVIGDILHKTNIEVSPVGVKAGAATKVEIVKSCAEISPKQVILDRPFIYAIIDNTSGLPIFLGTVENPEAN